MQEFLHLKFSLSIPTSQLLGLANREVFQPPRQEFLNPRFPAASPLVSDSSLTEEEMQLVSTRMIGTNLYLSRYVHFCSILRCNCVFCLIIQLYFFSVSPCFSHSCVCSNDPVSDLLSDKHISTERCSPMWLIALIRMISPTEILTLRSEAVKAQATTLVCCEGSECARRQPLPRLLLF